MIGNGFIKAVSLLEWLFIWRAQILKAIGIYLHAYVVCACVCVCYKPIKQIFYINENRIIQFIQLGLKSFIPPRPPSGKS